MSNKAKFCTTCHHWEKDVFKSAGDTFGVCHDVVASSKVKQDSEAKINEGTVYTESYFGCIYWRENDGVLVKIDPKLGNEKK